ncbi:YbfB/YjiJ family MFS transporter [Acinetobacter sp. 1000160]|uniref:YbfB/YjiJ family MFS transporter n=1 Tax=Acinetobacter sp. 1000160 TaxID=1310800 RepID=UPI00044C6987|nr:YbfB/YjiJ family MFS transporter [Acinetobacter sp. 1000160]EXB47494.1 major Facilitator Superfamily protein [Acinetobacter baumannii 146457]EYT23909.1 major Facilitator Superfamily protein [Acinetobacter sp. 1000160]
MNTAISKQGPLKSAFSAALIMAIGMGFGRFAFTAVYPHMIAEGILSLHSASIAASANYAGYLFGALFAIKIQSQHSYATSVFATIGTTLCLILLAYVDSASVIIFIRGLAGVLSAFAMVSASLWLLEQQKQSHQAPILYAGVGLGIALSAELLVFGTQLDWQSKSLWLFLGASSLILGFVAIVGLSRAQPRSAFESNLSHSYAKTPKAISLIMIYALAGFGYIITATYLPLLVRQALPNIEAAHIWAIFGLGAIPSCFFWHYLHNKLGTRVALSSNLGLQAIGVVLPIIIPTALGYLLSALLVGGTFMGTVTIAMPVAQRITRQSKSNLIAIMTVVYGLGQIIGPITANALFTIYHTLNSSLITAATALLIATLMSLKSTKTIH